MLKEKRPPIKETVGAQYICFALPGTNGEFTGTYEEDIEKTEVVKSVKVSEGSENTPIYGSGKIYQTNSLNSGTEISVEVIAFPEETITRMRGESVSQNGLILSGADSERPFFAYGKVVILSGKNYRYEWFPKCQLVSNTDDIETKEDKVKEQNDTFTIQAMPFDDFGNIKAYVESTLTKQDKLTEGLFFSKPIMNDADLESILTVSEQGPEQNEEEA